MKQKTNNELMAEFMGYKYVDDDPENYPDGYYYHPDTYDSMVIQDMEYDSCWNTLMVVWRKFRNLKFDLYGFPRRQRHRFHCEKIIKRLDEVDIDGVWSELAKGIKWYNTVITREEHQAKKPNKKMKIILKQRGQGKTRLLIEEAAKGGYYIVCRSSNECSRIAAVAANLGYNIPFPISYDDFHEKRFYGRDIKGFLIDQADDYLQRFTSVPIVTITLTKNSSEKLKQSSWLTRLISKNKYMKKNLKSILVLSALLLSFTAGIFAKTDHVTKLRVRVVGYQGESLINANTTVEHVSGFHPTTQVEKNVYGDPSSPEETLSITGIPDGETGEIIVKIEKSLRIP